MTRGASMAYRVGGCLRKGATNSARTTFISLRSAIQRQLVISIFVICEPILTLPGNAQLKVELATAVPERHQRLQRGERRFHQRNGAQGQGMARGIGDYGYVRGMVTYIFRSGAASGGCDSPGYRCRPASTQSVSAIAELRMAGGTPGMTIAGQHLPGHRLARPR